jgi:hypothetical protein
LRRGRRGGPAAQAAARFAGLGPAATAVRPPRQGRLVRASGHSLLPIMTGAGGPSRLVARRLVERPAGPPRLQPPRSPAGRPTLAIRARGPTALCLEGGRSGCGRRFGRCTGWGPLNGRGAGGTAGSRLGWRPRLAKHTTGQARPPAPRWGLAFGAVGWAVARRPALPGPAGPRLRSRVWIVRPKVAGQAGSRIRPSANPLPGTAIKGARRRPGDFFSGGRSGRRGLGEGAEC